MFMFCLAQGVKDTGRGGSRQEAMQQAAAKVKALPEKLLPPTLFPPSGAGEAGAEDGGQEDEPDVLAPDQGHGPGGAGLLPGQGGQGPELPGHLGLGGSRIRCLHLTKM